MEQSGFMDLSRRERQIMDIIYRIGEASVADVLKNLPDPPGYNSIRVILTILEDKGHLKHRQEGQKYIYMPIEKREQAKKSALRHMVATFFEGSAPNVLSTLLDISASRLTEEELEELAAMIEKAKKEKQR